MHTHKSPSNEDMPLLSIHQVTLADRQADEASPLYSAKTFEQLNLYVVNVDVQSVCY